MLYNANYHQDIRKNLMHKVSTKQTTSLERLSIYYVHRFAILQAALKSHENYDPRIHMALTCINALLVLKYVHGYLESTPTTILHEIHFQTRKCSAVNTQCKYVQTVIRSISLHIDERRRRKTKAYDHFTHEPRAMTMKL